MLSTVKNKSYDLLDAVLLDSVLLNCVPRALPAIPSIARTPSEKIPAGISMDTVKSKKIGKGCRIGRDRAGKFVYLTISTKNMAITFEENSIIKLSGFHRHDEEGTIASRIQPFFLSGYESQITRKEVAREMAERHRIQKNAALDA